jgi:thiamine biosynthesis lipoprotein ApbE
VGPFSQTLDDLAPLRQKFPSHNEIKIDLAFVDFEEVEVHVDKKPFFCESPGMSHRPGAIAKDTRRTIRKDPGFSKG